MSREDLPSLGMRSGSPLWLGCSSSSVDASIRSADVVSLDGLGALTMINGKAAMSPDLLETRTVTLS